MVVTLKKTGLKRGIMRPLWRVFFFALGSTLPALAYSEKLPLWEFGAGVAGLNLPHYRGSDEEKSYLLPVPYLIYRGERLRLDDRGMRGRIFQTDRAKLDLSLAGGVPVPRDADGARAGMPGLNPTVEFGPSFDIRLMDSDDRKTALWLRLPVRAVFSVGRDMGHQGWSFAPYVEYIYRDGHRYPFKLGVSLGPLFADEKYHNYFYEVDRAYATAVRPEYHPGGGYSGGRITLTLQRRFGDFWAGVFGRYDMLDGAAFENSPLVRTNNYHAIGFAVSWIFLKSSRMVEDGTTEDFRAQSRQPTPCPEAATGSPRSPASTCPE